MALVFFAIIFVAKAVYFTNPVQRELGILRLLYKPYQLLHRAIQLSHNVLNGKHGAKRKLAIKHRGGRKKSNQDVFAFINKKGTCLLILP